MPILHFYSKSRFQDHYPVTIASVMIVEKKEENELKMPKNEKVEGTLKNLNIFVFL